MTDPSKFADQTTPTLIEHLQRLEGTLASRKPGQGAKQEFEQLDELNREINQRVQGGDKDAFAFRLQQFAKDAKPLFDADLPDLPHQANVPRIPNHELDRLTMDVEQRIARFGELYSDLNRSQSQWVRETLDAMFHALQEERASRGLPPLSTPKPEQKEQQVSAGPHAQDDSSPSGESRPVERGKFCDLVIDEIKRIKNLALSSGRSMAEIKHEHPQWAVWKVQEQLSPEEQETFKHPNQWGPVVGYAKMLLRKSHGVSVHTITSWVKAYRRKDTHTKKAG